MNYLLLLAIATPVNAVIEQWNHMTCYTHQRTMAKRTADRRYYDVCVRSPVTIMRIEE